MSPKWPSGQGLWQEGSWDLCPCSLCQSLTPVPSLFLVLTGLGAVRQQSIPESEQDSGQVGLYGTPSPQSSAALPALELLPQLPERASLYFSILNRAALTPV